MFIPITKVDSVRREVWGVAAEEAPDKSGEIMDYDSSVAHWREWSKSIQDASGGKSLGNVRGMHGNIAAGKVVSIEFDDTARKIPVGVKVVDDNEWRKVEEGVYTGFSVGGKYERIWQDGALKRYTARPSEISLVDNPCMVGATFQMVKADGTTELRKFQEIAKVDKREDVTPKEGEAKYGDVKFADEKNKKYPIDTAEHIRAAWNYINKPDNADKYSADDVKAIKAKIVAAWKATIDKEGPPEAAEKVVGASNLQKAGARHSATDMSLIQEMHDKAVALGANCEAMGKLHKDMDGDDDYGVTGMPDPDGDSDDPMHEEPAAWMAFMHSVELSSVADALSMLGRLAGSMADTDPVCAAKITDAVKLITEALASKADTMSQAMAAAQAEEAAEPPDENALEMAVKATLTKMLPGLLDEKVNAVLSGAPLAKADGLQKLETTVSDIAARLGALDERLAKAEHPDSGPVLREVGGAFANKAQDEESMLSKMIAEENNPTIRQTLMNKRVELQMRNIHRAGGTPIR